MRLQRQVPCFLDDTSARFVWAGLWRPQARWRQPHTHVCGSINAASMSCMRMCSALVAGANPRHRPNHAAETPAAALRRLSTCHRGGHFMRLAQYARLITLVLLPACSSYRPSGKPRVGHDVTEGHRRVGTPLDCVNTLPVTSRTAAKTIDSLSPTRPANNCAHDDPSESHAISLSSCLPQNWQQRSVQLRRGPKVRQSSPQAR